PVHTMYDGDTIFSLATGEVSASVDLIGTLAADVLAEAVIQAILNAEGIVNFPSSKDVRKSLRKGRE
ncbi:peptidase S58 family protein, partial [Fictibacillus sp. NRS-1165]